MFAAAGIVVTEISTPISAPDFADVSDSTPADPGHEGDEEPRKSGFEMNSVSGRSPGRSRPGRARLVKTSVVRKASAMPSGKPTASAISERRARSPLELHDRHAQAGQRPELGPDHHGADDQDRLVEHDAHRGDLHRERP